MRKVIVLFLIFAGVGLYLVGGPNGDKQRDSRSRTTLGDDRTPLNVRTNGRLHTLEFAVVAADGARVDDVDVSLRGSVTRKTRSRSRVQIYDLPTGIYALTIRQGDASAACTVEIVGDTDLGTLTLAVDVVVQGHVFNAVTGHRVEGATVVAVDATNAWRHVGSLPGAREVARATSGADGSYRLRIPGPGRYGLRAWHESAGSTDITPWAIRRSEANVDLSLRPSCRVRGKVVDTTRAPVAGARVRISRAGSLELQEAPLAEIITGNDGRFALRVVPNWDRVLAVDAPGYAPYRRLEVVRFPSPELAIVLEEGVSLVARVVDAATRRALGGATVRVRFRECTWETTTGEDGVARLEHVAVGRSRGNGFGGTARLWLMVSAPGRVSRQVGRGDPPARGETWNLGDIELDRGATVRGRVVLAGTNAPIAGAVVMWGPRPVTLYDERTSSDHDGLFELESVPDSASVVFAVHPDYLPTMEVEQALFKSPSPKRKADSDITIVLERGAFLDGVVVQANGQPAAGAEVSFTGGAVNLYRRFLAPPQPVRADDAGRFRMSGFRESAVLRVAAQDSSGARVVIRVRVADGGPLRLVLQPSHTVTGIVADETGKVVAGAFVLLTNVAAGTSLTAQTSDGGRFAIEDVPGGDAELRVSHDRYLPTMQSVAVAEGERRIDVGTIRLTRGGRIEGILLDEGGAPMEHVRLSAMVPGDEKRRVQGYFSARSDKRGRFLIGGLARETTYRLRVQKRGLTGQTMLARSGTENVRFRMEATWTLRGHVTKNGHPVAGALASARLSVENGPIAIGDDRSDRTGSFQISGLPVSVQVDLFVETDAGIEGTWRALRAGSEQRVFAISTDSFELQGVVVDSNGQPVPSASVVVSRDGVPITRSETDARGEFEFTVLGGRAGLKIAARMANQTGVSSGRVPIASGDSAVKLVVKLGHAIRGRLDGPAGRVYRVEALGGGDRVVAATIANQSNGKFALWGLREGQHRIRVSSRDSTGTNWRIEIERVAATGGDEPLKIELAR